MPDPRFNAKSFGIGCSGALNILILVGMLGGAVMRPLSNSERLLGADVRCLNGSGGGSGFGASGATSNVVIMCLGRASGKISGISTRTASTVPFIASVTTIHRRLRVLIFPVDSNVESSNMASLHSAAVPKGGADHFRA